MATPEQFFDPFFRKDLFSPNQSNIPDESDAPADFKVPADSEVPGEPNGVANSQPQGLELPIAGQGTIAVRSTAKDLLQFAIASNLMGGPKLYLEIGSHEYKLYYKTVAGAVDMTSLVSIIKSKADCFLDSVVPSMPGRPDDETTYWLSVDRNNGYVRYGKGFTNKSMMLLQLSLKHVTEDGVMVWNSPDRDGWLKSLKAVDVVADQEALPLEDIAIQPLPIVVDLPPFVIPTEDITLEQLEQGNVTVPGNLPDACQVLYSNVSGKNIRLNDYDFPEFTMAIQYSCVTPGCWAYKKLASKVTEFGNDPNETYLRITIGLNQGNSPGIPYVLEIWPAGHYSPIHDHGDSCAVIKVLHGEINATYYDSLEPPQPIGEANLTEGRITWLGMQNYQIHKLHNVSTDVCCTIQCYSYEKNENKHEDVFNYTSNEGKVIPWTPTSDSSYSGFKHIIKREWEGRPQK